jgi:hypothetical protein
MLGLTVVERLANGGELRRALQAKAERNTKVWVRVAVQCDDLAPGSSQRARKDAR